MAGERVVIEIWVGGYDWAVEAQRFADDKDSSSLSRVGQIAIVLK